MHRAFVSNNFRFQSSGGRGDWDVVHGYFYESTAQTRYVHRALVLEIIVQEGPMQLFGVDIGILPCSKYRYSYPLRTAKKRKNELKQGQSILRLSFRPTFRIEYSGVPPVPLLREARPMAYKDEKARDSLAYPRGNMRLQIKSTRRCFGLRWLFGLLFQCHLNYFNVINVASHLLI